MSSDKWLLNGEEYIRICEYASRHVYEQNRDDCVGYCLQYILENENKYIPEKSPIKTWTRNMANWGVREWLKQEKRKRRVQEVELAHGYFQGYFFTELEDEILHKQIINTIAQIANTKEDKEFFDEIIAGTYENEKTITIGQRQTTKERKLQELSRIKCRKLLNIELEKHGVIQNGNKE